MGKILPNIGNSGNRKWGWQDMIQVLKDCNCKILGGTLLSTWEIPVEVVSGRGESIPGRSVMELCLKGAILPSLP